MSPPTHTTAKQKVAVLFYSMKAKIKKKHTLSDALKYYESHGAATKISQCEEIELNGCFPPIEVMDRHGLRMIRNCRTLTLSTNKITEIADLSPLLRLEILSIGRNEISRLENLNVARTLRELHISFNDVDSLKGIEALKQLETLSIAHNRIDDWAEFHRIQHLPKLEELIFSGNPLHVRFPGTKKEWRRTVLQKLPNLRKLDGERFFVVKRVSSRRSLASSGEGSMSGEQMTPFLNPMLVTPHGTHTYHAGATTRFDATYASPAHDTHQYSAGGGSSPLQSRSHWTHPRQYAYSNKEVIQRPHHPPVLSVKRDENAAQDPTIKSVFGSNYGGRVESDDDLSSDTYV